MAQTKRGTIRSRLAELFKSASHGAFSSAHLEFLVFRRDIEHVANPHRIHPDASPFWPPIHPDQLDWLLGQLKQVGSFVDVRELVSIPVPVTEWVFVLSFETAGDQTYRLMCRAPTGGATVGVTMQQGGTAATGGLRCHLRTSRWYRECT